MMNADERAELAVRLLEANSVDDALAGQIDTALFPEWPGQDAIDVRRKLAHRERAEFHRALLAEYNGITVGRLVISSSWWHDRCDPIYLTLNVHPDYQGRGVGQLLWTRVAHELRTHPASNVSVMVRDDDTRSLEIVRQNGFIKTMSFIYSQLDLEEGVQSTALDKVSGLRREGYTFYRGAELRELFTDWQERWWRLHVAIAADIPSVENHEPLTFEAFKRLVIGSKTFRARQWTIAVHAGEWVALTGLRPFNSDAKSSAVYLTGTVRSHRRRGVGMAIKTVSAQHARERGIRAIFTDNEENNPMWALNRMLGFQRLYTASNFRAPKPKVRVGRSSRLQS